MGGSPSCGSDCAGAPMLPFLYILFNLAFNIAALNLLKTAGTFCFCTALAHPCCLCLICCFCQSEGSHVPWFIVLSPACLPLLEHHSRIGPQQTGLMLLSHNQVVADALLHALFCTNWKEYIGRSTRVTVPMLYYRATHYVLPQRRLPIGCMFRLCTATEPE